MTRPFRIGLTGSIGMGKSTTAAMFAQHGIPVWDADAAVHRLYAKGGAGVAAIAAIRPEAIVEHAVSRERLKAWIAADPDALPRIEAAIHPLVAEDRAAFVTASGAPMVLLDIPLLFETGGDKDVDFVVTVSAPEPLQRARVLARPGMTVAQFEALKAQQLPDAEKRRRAAAVVTTETMEDTARQVAELVARLRDRAHA
ncbi:dephospho-CoA kinase [Oceaniovalibus guishaninsula JLT2003]|uniref:Dephospho-CoA kinase n=1 Tax=Oceaniovalibus guishaninsula JLT2003 TaxID=1231392 RepID=K2GPW2_9RHOB|nr:dephospho-CoA kinase [Oceaniovalibus guishaninsula]EKE44676.1 dephospho-CoA kinase [Oceaniovalibus guishaninsula JLT2003]